MVGTVTLELVFTATTDAAQWVQIYGLLRPTDAHDDDDKATISSAMKKAVIHELSMIVNHLSFILLLLVDLIYDEFQV